ncbi:MAG: peptidoglycan DD-metalloendopeptidase family protein [Clostridia bacterium]|nr:peptidoglycan DD-metalloendopeptidase family protein [Clostridia bacterium]
MNFANKRGNIMRRFSNIVDKTKKKNVIGISCVTAGIIIVSSAIIFSIPSVNFAVFKENGLEEVENNTVLETTKEETVENIVKDNTSDNTETAKNVVVEEQTNTTISEPVLENETKDESNNVDDVKNNDKAEKIVEPTVQEEPKLITTKKVSTVSKEFFSPVSGGIPITTKFSGVGNHAGVDYKLEQGKTIQAAASGKVIYSGYKGSYGNCIIIEHENGFRTVYAHCSELLVTVDEQVTTGQKIAESGATGNATGPCLHFEIRDAEGRYVDPEMYLN